MMGEDEAGTRARFNAYLHELIEPAMLIRRTDSFVPDHIGSQDRC